MIDEPRQVSGSALATHFRQYTPQLLVERELACARAPQVPRSVRFPAAALIADLTGFTALTDRLVARSREGAEEVQGLLNRWFGPMTEEVYLWGGQVLHFSGDAVLALWPCEQPGDLPLATARARGCAGAMIAGVDRYEAAAGLRPSLRIAIATGDVWTAALGGTEDRWELLTAGSAIADLGPPFGQAAPGEIVLSAHASAMLDGHGPDEPPPPSPSPEWQAPDPETLKMFVPRTLRARLEAGHSAWLSEFRPVSVAFINLIGFDYSASDVLGRVHGVIRHVQRAVYQLGGSINQVMVDEKGT